MAFVRLNKRHVMLCYVMLLFGVVVFLFVRESICSLAVRRSAELLRHKPTLQYFGIVTLRAKLSGAVYCYRSCLWRAGLRASFVGLLPR